MNMVKIWLAVEQFIIANKYINLVIDYLNTFNLLVLLQKSDLFNLCMTDKNASYQHNG